MFERLAQQVLGKFLSKYFTEESLAENKIYTSTQLGVWSGYVSLENLELKKEFVNSRLRSKAQPFEIVHCTLRRVEITIPWAKLSNPISFRDHRNKEDAVVVVVMDGIHLLARTSFDFDDVALRQEEMKKRRQALADPYRRVDANSEGMSYKEILKKRLKDGLFQEIASKIHIHLRDLHIRLEDTESDPISPHACGITMESMHIQHDDESAANEGVVSKIAQLNHLAVYWNALGYGDALPAENSILHQTCRENREMISRALNFCIARRASMIASPSRDPYIPTHTYLLLPVDGTWHGRLSTNPTDLSDKPAVQVYISINPVFGQLRDFQCVQILRLASEYKNHKYVKRYRRFRPSVSVLDDPTAWWLYAARAIRYQLRETFLRWSWGRFADVYKVRNRYMNLYERKMLFPVLNGDVSDRPSDDVDEASFSQSTPSGGRLDITRQRIEKMRDGPDGTTPDDGAGPSTPIRQEDKKTPLTKADFLELQSLEDGLIGDISIDTILLFRALVNLRLPPATTTPPQSSWRRSLFWPSMVDNDLVQDSEAKVELETLLSYLEKSSGTMATSDTSDADRNAISIVILFEELSLSLLSPLSATSEESPVRQIHEKFLDFSMMDLKIEYYLKGDYEGKEMRLSIGDLVASEIRRDKSHHIVAKQVGKGSRNESGTSDNGDGDPLVVVRHLQSAKNSSGSDVALVVVINLMELSLIPECEWISHVKSLLHHIKKVPNVADYWDNLSLAYVNSLALGRLGLIAKAESAIPEHKNLDAEILVQCPILRIGDGKGGHLVMELGRAHFKTERLAGVPRSQVFPTKGCEDGVGNSSMELPPLDDASVMGSVSGRTWSSRPRLETPSIAEKRTDRQSFFSSAMSVDSKTHGGLGNRSAAGSIYFDEPLIRMNVVDDEMEEERKQEATALNYLFYDVFSFHLQTGKITLCGENDVFEISCGFEMHTVLKKSVLPADHTLCKMKTNSVIKNLKIDLNRNALSMITDAAKAWKALMRSRVSVDSSMLNKYKATFPRITLVEMPSPLEDPSSEDESLSQLDENEFFDANQTNESFVGDGSAVWFDDNWISDAESFIEGDSRSAQDERRRRRRRAGSVSDVSSASDQSTKEPMKDTKGKKIQQGNAYLSAENLARLEEGAGEDESVGESVVDMDDVSFHSVMSEAGQEQVARDLEDNMEQVSQKVEELASQLRDLCQFTDRTSAPEHEMMRKKKTSMRLQLSRARAELNGLRALREDLERLIAENPRANNREGDDGIMKAYRRSAHAKSARALLAARNRRDLVLENNWHHSLTQYLNREIFQGSILVQHCHIMLHLSEDFGEKGSHPSNPTFDFVACHTGLAILHQVHNTKLYLTSDQVSASLREKSDPTIRPKVLFSGGNNDTLLPSHFPHLVSRSMEEKFFRGTFQWGKRRPTDAGSRQTRTLKSRLIVGDVEIFPSKQTLSPLYRLVRHIKAGEHSPTESSRLRPQGSEISEDATLPSIDKHPMYVDLAVRLSSIRLIMGINGKIAGAAVATEAAFRLVQATAPAREKLQVDMRCTNLQILEIYSLEAGHGYEIMGRRDPYNALVQVRLKSQLVAEKNCGGWVVGSENCDLENHPRGSATLARNAHVGLKINPLTLVAAPEAIALLREHAEELAQVFSYETNSRMKSERVETKNKSLVHRLSASYPLRWRFDGSMKRLMVNFPERHRGDWNFADETASHMRMGFSVILCLQESTSHKGHVSMLMALSEVSLIRSNDDWPVLEHFTILCDATVETRIAARYRMSATIAETLATPQLKLDTGSPINEIAAVLHRYGWDSISLQHDKSINYGLILMITPLKVNLTAPIIGLVTQINQSLKGSLLKKKLTNSSDDIPPPSFLDQRQRLGFHIVLEEVELEVMRETETKPMAHAKSLISFTMADTRIDFEQRDQIAASILIRNSSLFDLSSSRGVQVVGENIGGCEKDSPYFVRINLYVDEAKDGPTNITLEINWGSIQCLVMPTFLVSLLQLKDDVASALRRSKTASTCSEKGNILDRFVGFDHDVNLLLSAHADAFECILSSKDISEYVRQSGTESIGVVTLRWKASLTVLLALDTLKGSSVAWLTLNPDGKFTDEADIGLFKDFVNRYLSPSSGLLAGSDEIGQKVMNAFTARLSLHVSDFQVIRTTISAKPLKPPPKPVSYKSAHRICFLVKPPSAGEQRVTNPIDLVLIYKAAGAAMVGTSDGDGVPQVEISQLVEAKARFVDILLYISQSADGFTESFKTTVKPVLEILKNDDSSRRMRNEGHLSTMTANDHFAMNPKRNLVHLLKCAPTMCTVQLEGLQITCVPSGATRLNESPIIKIELKQFSSGLASVPLPFDGRAMRSGTSSKDLLSAVDLMHTNIAGWLACEITGHYHNRRLVAWEPFVEPWNVEFRFGVDAVDAFGLTPIASSRSVELKSPSATRNSLENFTLSSLGDGTGDRLRDFGRLFRAPFQSSLSAKQTTNDRAFISQPDFCYLMLASTSRTTILSVMYSPNESAQERETRLFSRLPRREKIDWLRGFGFPGRENGELYSATCVLSDSKTLNINITGALLENVLGYLHSLKSDELRQVAPHWIRNDTGMTIRFQEVLDPDRIRRGEEAGKVTVVDGSEVPLTLKRSLSQTCDPHRAYIYLEIGSFEDTVGRIRHDDFDIPKGALSSSFFFKAAAKVPVDTVGVHRYPLDRNSETRAEGNGTASDSRVFGWIIVRVALRDGIKVVSVESPFVLKSTADSNLICEIRDFHGLSLIWRCLVPKADRQIQGTRCREDLVSVPADIVPFLHDGSYSFSVFALPRTLSVGHEAELTSFGGNKAIQVDTPPPFSPQSYGKGMIGEEEITLETLQPDGEGESFDEIHLTVCSFRIGSFSGVRAAIEVPEQRMMVFRAPLAIRNCLALPVAVQVRVKGQGVGEKSQHNQGLVRLKTFLSEWEDLGVLECGQSVNWTGANSIEKVQLRVRFVGTDGDNSRRFPGWSSAIYIPAREESSRASTKHVDPIPKAFARMKVFDADNISLNLSVAFDDDINAGSMDPGVHSDIRSLSHTLSAGTRAVSIYVPYWIVDSTNQDLEFFSGATIAGQLGNESQPDHDNDFNDGRHSSLGLAELLDNANFLNLPSSRSFDVMMLGDESSTRLMVRKRLARQSRNLMRRLTPPWSDPIPLQAERLSQYDITVLAPNVEKDERGPDAEDIRSFDRFVLRSKVLTAPEKFGGKLGTKLIHVVNRYCILNETGRDVEIASDYGLGLSVLVRGTGIPQPFHFDDTSPIRVRFKEFGWTWSGKFKIRLNRPEVTMRLRHRMKGQTVIVTVELIEKKSSTNMIILRQSSHPPFRLENHTMFPLHFGQSSARMGSEDTEIDAMLLPYQSTDFAWDEPELRRRVLLVKTTDCPPLPQGCTLGRFQLDKLAPGTILSLESALFAGEIVADGPTRVMRITDASMPSLSSTRHDGLNDFQHRPYEKTRITMSLSVKLLHGIGISIVDWSPQELLYVRLEDIQVERKFDGKFDDVNMSAGNVKLNNQLWVTPYPVLLKMGRRVDPLHPIRRKNRRHDALNLSWKRSLNTYGGYGNVTLLERVEVSSEPIFVNVDGQVADLLFRMGQQVSRIWRGEKQFFSSVSRDEDLQKLLYLTGTVSEEADTARRGFSPYHQSSDGDLMTTAAVASKLKAQPLPFVTIHTNSPRTPRSVGARKEAPPELGKPQHKYYIEKLRISATKADLSWSGPLPGLMSSLLLRALTFERLPVRLRPYSISHSYGNARDHMQSVKSHYLSFWRVFDLLIGLSSNPTFLFRGVVYTSRETCATILDSWAADGRKIAKSLSKFSRKRKETFPLIYDNGQRRELVSSFHFGWTLLSPFAKGASSIFDASSSLASFVASMLKYGAPGSKRLAARGLVRSRNPRLFAHMDGRDLLVEYVEGENAGKALLSRVRMGMHLGEGYIYHSEGARVVKAKPRSLMDLDSSPLIVMITSERTLLLNGKLDWDFCSVVWEATFTNIVHLELVLGNEMSVTGYHDEVVIWYLSDTSISENTSDDKATIYAKAIVAGVDVLHNISVCVPHGAGAQLAIKMSRMDKRLAQDFETLASSKIKQD